MTDGLVLACALAGALLYARFLCAYLWRFPGESSVDGWALLTSAAGWTLLLSALFLDHWWNVPAWLWLAVVAPFVLASGVLKNLLYERAKRDWLERQRNRQRSR